MKKIRFLLPALFSILMTPLFSQNVCITTDGSYTADESAMLDVKSTSKGLLIPRLTTAQKEAISLPAKGLLVFDIDNADFFYYRSPSLGWLGLITSEIIKRKAFSIFVGENSGVNITAGIGNSFFGHQSGMSITEGDYNTLVGTNAGRDLVTGNNNTFVGCESGESTLGSGNVFLGYNAGKDETGSDKLYIDNNSTSSPLIYGDFSTDELKFNGSVGIGTTPSYKLDVNGDINLNNSAIRISGTKVLHNIGAMNIFCGDDAGTSYESGGTGGNSSLGSSSLRANTTGGKNTAVGSGALRFNTTGNKSTALGCYALYNQTGNPNDNDLFNVAVGYYSLRSNNPNSQVNGRKNVAVGSMSLYTNSTGFKNVAIGQEAGYSNEGGFSNVYIGSLAGYENETGNNNVVLNETYR
ncbi:MAG: hypothetical protein K9H15_11715 [Bacteroidales bacterium]|nr:hypothetical protein [Bacteroidales bacterium]MCF8351825.1 hypothetical protein [Bacteroidales bacterium]